MIAPQSSSSCPERLARVAVEEYFSRVSGQSRSWPLVTPDTRDTWQIEARVAVEQYFSRVSGQSRSPH